jgi:predicted deacylase
VKPEQLIPLRALASGETLHLPVYRFHGSAGAPSAYLQASLHGAEVQGNWVIAELLELLPKVKVLGNITLVPVANPYGQNHKIGDYTLGRFDPVDGDNWNRMFVDCTKFGDTVSTEWPAAKNELRARVAAELARAPAHESYSKKLARTLQGLAFQHDFMLDLHCAALCESYAYVPEYAFSSFKDLPCRHAVRVHEGFGGAMDEAFAMPWWRLGRRIEAATGNFPAIPEGYTLELGHQDWSDVALAKRQASGILRYLARRGVIEGNFPAMEFASRYSCALKDFHTDVSHRGGFVGLRAKLGEIQEKGAPYCEYLGFRDFERETVPCHERRITLVFTNASSVHEGTELGKSLVNFTPV